MAELGTPTHPVGGPGGAYTPPTILVDSENVSERTPEFGLEPDAKSGDDQNVVLSAFSTHGGDEPPNLAGLNPNKPPSNLESEGELFHQGESLLSGGGSKAVTHRDHRFALLFYACIGFCLLCFVLFYVFRLGGTQTGPETGRILGPRVCAALFMSATIAFGISVVWLMILNVAAKWMIKISIVFAFVALLCSSVVGFMKGWISVGLISLGLSLIHI
eukprot:TRINITY_DN5167_c0_g1_i3.p1 TRINITY_DN5167_c0_g1~~TRINITY_DN5167_c0_g1_i3.p1  ORF type:complete len:217 (-),score=34.93 TRINITY_DN5167_c0_g1_i3:161-811(-)